jgi:hypothetical protein
VEWQSILLAMLLLELFLCALSVVKFKYPLYHQTSIAILLCYIYQTYYALISFAYGSLSMPDVPDSSVLNLLTFGDQCTQPDTETGDIVFVLQLKDHPKFKRKGDDLFVQHTLTLTEALCGFQFPLTHLDGRQLLIKCSPGEIVKPGVCMCSFLDSPSPFIIFFFVWKNSSLFQN